MGEFELYEFINESLVKITQVPLVDSITSFDLNFRNSHLEVIYTDSLIEQSLTFAEYDYNTQQWVGFSLPQNYPYEILGTHFDGNQWYIYHQNDCQIGGMCFKPIFEEVTSSPIKQKEDLHIVFSRETILEDICLNDIDENCSHADIQQVIADFIDNPPQ